MQTNQFEEWLTIKKLSANTKKQYLRYHQKIDLATISHQTLTQFLKKHNHTIARAYLKNLLQYIKQSTLPEPIKLQALTYEIPKITGRPGRKIPDRLTKDQIITIAKAFENKREKIMLLTQFYGGLRVAELIGIKHYQFEWETWLQDPNKAGTLKVKGKGNKERPVFMPNYLMRQLYNYIKNDIPQTRKQDSETPIFDIGIRRYQTLLKKAGKQALNRNIHPHLIRHSTASYLLDQGLNLIDIKEYLGQEDIKTTQIYLHINPAELKQKVSGAFN